MKVPEYAALTTSTLSILLHGSETRRHVITSLYKIQNTTEQCQILPGAVGSRVDVVVDSVTGLSPR